MWGSDYPHLEGIWPKSLTALPETFGSYPESESRTILGANAAGVYGFYPSNESNLHLSIYCFPVPDEPEFGVLTTVDADYRGTRVSYTIGYGIDQESAIYTHCDTIGSSRWPGTRGGPRRSI